jgi:hypothetical protein
MAAIQAIKASAHKMVCLMPLCSLPGRCAASARAAARARPPATPPPPSPAMNSRPRISALQRFCRQAYSHLGGIGTGAPPCSSTHGLEGISAPYRSETLPERKLQLARPQARREKLASSTAMMPVRKMPSKVPAPPIEATGAPRPRTASRLRRSAPISVPRLPAT